MAKNVLDKTRITIVAGSTEAVAEVDFETKAQKADKATGLPLWNVEVFFTEQGEDNKSLKLKIASQEQPKFPALVPLTVDGDIVVNPWLSGNQVKLSYKVIGKLIPAKPANRGE